MQKHLGYATDNAGNVVSTTSVRVKIHGSVTDATIYSDDGVTTKLNPFDVESGDGSYYFYAANGSYDVVLTSPDATFDADDTADVRLFDANDGVGTYPVTVYGAKCDGVTDDTDEIQDAIDAASGGGTVVFPTGTCRVTAELTGVAEGTTFQGLGNSWISKEFNGNLFTITTGYNRWLDFNVDQNGQTYTGPVIRFQSGSHTPEWSGGHVIDGGDSIFLYEDTGGSLGRIHHSTFTIHSSVASTSAVVKRTVSTVESAASPRYFDHIQCVGPNTRFANANGFHGAYFDSIYSNGIILGDNTLNALITNSRMVSVSGETIHFTGNSVAVLGNVLGGQGAFTVDAGYVYGTFANNMMDPSLTFTDNSIKTPGNSTPVVENPITPSVNRLYLSTKTATTSGTTVSYTSLPSGIKRITIMFAGVSLSGTDNILVRIGDAGGLESSGYLSSSSDDNGTVVASTSGFIITDGGAANVVSGVLTLELYDAATFAWVAHGTFKLASGTMAYAAGDKALSAELTQLQILLSGSDTFDAGAVNISYQR